MRPAGSGEVGGSKEVRAAATRAASGIPDAVVASDVAHYKSPPKVGQRESLGETVVETNVSEAWLRAR